MSKLSACYLISEKMFASHVLPDKHQKPLRRCRHANYQESGGHFVTNFWEWKIRIRSAF